MKTISKLLNLLITAGLSLIILILLSGKYFGIKAFSVLSGSMEPSIHTGALVFINQNDKEIYVGDIIAFTNGDISVTHRVSEIRKDGSFITKGDANEATDSAPIAREQVIGKYLFSVPAMGFVVTYLRTPYGLLLICGMIAICSLITVYQNMKKEN